MSYRSISMVANIRGQQRLVISRGARLDGSRGFQPTDQILDDSRRSATFEFAAVTNGYSIVAPRRNSSFTFHRGLKSTATVESRSATCSKSESVQTKIL